MPIVLKREQSNAAMNRIAKATGADVGILKNVSDAKGTFKELKIDILEDFPNHKFKSYSDEELKVLADDIKRVGLIDPITVWETKDGHYYILSGHNRVRACKLNGDTTITCNVHKYTDINEAKLVVNTTNINRRGGFEGLSIEEKCLVIVDDIDALKELYKKDKEKYGIAEVIGFDAKNEVSVYYQISATQAAKYYKIGKAFKKEWLKLIPKHFNIKAAYQLAQLNRSNLKEIMENIVSSKENDDYIVKVSETQAKILKQMEKDDNTVDDMVSSLYSIATKKEKKSYTINFTNEIFAPYLKKIQKIDDETLSTIFVKALSDYFDK